MGSIFEDDDDDDNDGDDNDDDNNDDDNDGDDDDNNDDNDGYSYNIFEHRLTIDQVLQKCETNEGLKAAAF